MNALTKTNNELVQTMNNVMELVLSNPLYFSGDQDYIILHARKIIAVLELYKAAELKTLTGA